MSSAAPPLLLAIGLSGQALFGLRTGLQWYLSEKAQESVIPRSYWWISVVASVLLLAYAIERRDPVFILGPLVNLTIYLRNLWLSYRPRHADAPSHLALIGAGAAVSFGLLLYLHLLEAPLDPAHVPWLWLTVGLLGQAFWLSRFPIQWWVSEREGRSLLPPSFFWVSTVGAVFLSAYSIYRVDWVFILAYALNPIPSVRNLVLVYRKRRRDQLPAGVAAAPVAALAEPQRSQES